MCRSRPPNSMIFCEKENSGVTIEAASATGRDVDVVGRRVVAFLVDNVVILALILLPGTPLALLLTNLDAATLGPVAGFLLALAVLAASLVLVVGVFIGYYALLEGRRGQTLGKKLMGIEVIREDTGGVPGARAAALRALLLMLADGQFFCVVGFVSILATENHQRLGDMVAKTLVVRRARRDG